jgi:hypothetical protein
MKNKILISMLEYDSRDESVRTTGKKYRFQRRQIQLVYSKLANFQTLIAGNGTHTLTAVKRDRSEYLRLSKCRRSV